MTILPVPRAWWTNPCVRSSLISLRTAKRPNPRVWLLQRKTYVASTPFQSPALKDAKGAANPHHKKDEENKEPKDNVHFLPKFSDSVLRGMGQVVFANSPWSGAAIVGGLALADPSLAAMSLLGCTSATATAHLLLEEDDDENRSKIANGLYGYNGALVGCAFFVFLYPTCTPSDLVLWAVSGGTASTCVAYGLGKVLPTSLPQFTLAFNVVALGVFAITKPFRAQMMADPSTESADFTAALPSMDALFTSLALEAPWNGISQIFVAQSPLCGAAILAALYMQHWKPLSKQTTSTASAGDTGAVMHTLGGSVTGIATTLAVGSLFLAGGSPLSDISAGLVGFNPALTALAVHTFLQPSLASYALAGGGAVATTGLTAAMAPAAATTLGIPVCTLPFCIAASGCLLLADGLGIARRRS